MGTTAGSCSTWGFRGQRYDSASGLHYNYFRDFDPASGRYIQSDPIGLAGGLSTYAYADSRPADTIDPDGLQGVQVRRTAGGGFTATFDPVHTQAVARISQIQTLNPRFQYQSIGRHGQSLTRHDLNTLK